MNKIKFLLQHNSVSIVYFYLTLLSIDQKGGVRITYSELSKLCKLSRRTIERSLSSLIELGFITKGLPSLCQSRDAKKYMLLTLVDKGLLGGSENSVCQNDANQMPIISLKKQINDKKLLKLSDNVLQNNDLPLFSSRMGACASLEYNNIRIKEEEIKENNKTKEKKEEESTLVAIEQDFKEAWKEYKPVTIRNRTIGRGSCKEGLKAYVKARKKHAKLLILRGIHDYLRECAASGVNSAYFSTFLNREYFLIGEHDFDDKKDSDLDLDKISISEEKRSSLQYNLDVSESFKCTQLYKDLVKYFTCFHIYGKSIYNQRLLRRMQADTAFSLWLYRLEKKQRKSVVFVCEYVDN